MKQKGFTLIEILIVVFIIAMVAGMAGLSLQNDPRSKEMEREAKRLKFYLEMASDEAVFQNIDLGFFMTKNQLHPFVWEVVEEADPNDPESEDKYGWKAFENRLVNKFEFPEDYEQLVKIDGQEITLTFTLPDDEDEIQPQMYIASSGEQPVAEIELTLEEFNISYFIRGQGLGRYDIEQVTYEE